MRFIDLFAGVGGFRLGLEKANQTGELVHPRGYPEGQEAPVHGRSPSAEAGDDAPSDGGGEVFRCVWSCEVDRWCRAVYRHHWKETPAGDARQVRPDDIPDFDLLCAGFPCQSFSVAGKRKGFGDPRGTLFYEICRIARAKRPKLLLLENVAGLLSVDRGETFGAVLQELGDIGYGVEWQILNSKNHGVPQNRERVFIVGHLGGIRGQEVFPVPNDGGEADEDGAVVRTLCGGGHSGGLHSQTTGIAEGESMMIHNVYGGFGEKEPRVFEKHNPTIRTPKGGGHLPLVVLRKHRKDEIRNHGQIVPTLTESHEHHGGANVPMIMSKVGKGQSYELHEGECTTLRGMARHNNVPMVVKPCLTPDRAEKQQHGRRFKESGEPMFTLTGQDIHGVEIIEDFYKGRGDRVYRGTAPTLRGDRYGLKVANAVDCDGYLRFGQRPRDEDGKPMLIPIGYRRIRRLTPRECERLQGFPDDWTRWGIDEKGNKFELSDTQRYRQMGNAVTVNVVEFIARRLLR